MKTIIASILLIVFFASCGNTERVETAQPVEAWTPFVQMTPEREIFETRTHNPFEDFPGIYWVLADSFIVFFTEDGRAFFGIEDETAAYLYAPGYAMDIPADSDFLQNIMPSLEEFLQNPDRIYIAPGYAMGIPADSDLLQNIMPELEELLQNPDRIFIAHGYAMGTTADGDFLQNIIPSLEDYLQNPDRILMGPGYTMNYPAGDVKINIRDANIVIEWGTAP